MVGRVVPEGYHSVTPYLIVEGVPGLIEFMVEAFGGEETERLPGPDGTIMHAEVRIGDSVVMMGEATGGFERLPGSLYLYVADVDAVYERALQSGAASLSEPADQFYGDRSAAVKDPSGCHWWLATRQEDVSPEELQRRAEARSGTQ
jgi:uncharacterized glyoxalase superfamily protein PhnB